MRQLCILILFCSLGFSFQRSTPEDDHYVAAVVEYISDGNINLNLNNYVNLIKGAADQGADIVVFPELTLTDNSTYFEVPYEALQEHLIPALYPMLYDQFMVRISAVARQNEIYVVINGRERLNCIFIIYPGAEYCPERKEYIFNTNVVFDRTGALIDRYRKINLFGEDTHTPALRPDLGVFTTDFGVTFGHFIGFDLMYQVPAMQMVQKSHIKNIIFPSMWFSELPYLTAVQIQEAYAYALDVNFLGAGANKVSLGNTGAGIYSGKAGALISTIVGLPTYNMLVANVPKVPGQVTEPFPGPIYDNPADHDNLRLTTDPSLASHVSRLLKPGAQEFTLMHRDVSCNFRVTLNQRDGSTHYRYRATVFSGVRSFTDVATGGVRTCSVIACTGDEIGTCGMRFPTYTENTTAIFEELSLVATMPTPILNTTLDTDDSIVYPVSSKVSIMPLESKEYTYSLVNNNDVTVHTLTLTNQTAELYAFAIWGRSFVTDGHVEDPPLTDEQVDDQATTAAPSTDASAVHLLSRVLWASMVAVICYSQL